LCLFGDAGKGLLGFSVARLNPLRWSGTLSLKEGISQLQTVQAQAPDRQIVMKVPVDNTGTEQGFQSASEAIAHLESVCPQQKQAQDALEAANIKQNTAKARLSDAEGDAAEAQAKLQSAMDDLSSAEANLEDAKKKAAQTKAELDELSSVPCVSAQSTDARSRARSQQTHGERLTETEQRNKISKNKKGDLLQNVFLGLVTRCSR